MKNKHLVLIVMALFLVGLMSLLISLFNFSLKSVIGLCLSGLLVGLFINVINRLAVPSEWTFQHRFGFNSATVLVFYMLLIAPFWTGKALSFQTLFIGSILGVLVVRFFLKSNYTSAISKKSFDKTLLENEILSDFCSAKENGKTMSGVLILTNKRRLIFMPVDSEKPLFDFDLLELDHVTLQKRMGLPDGIIINNDINISVSYPLLWIQKIGAAQVREKIGTI